MSCLDLTAAVEAAAERAYMDYRMVRMVSVMGLPGAERLVDELPEWGDLPAIHQHDWRERVRGVVIAAEPAIASAAIPAPTMEVVDRIWETVRHDLVGARGVVRATIAGTLTHLRRTVTEDRP